MLPFPFMPIFILFLLCISRIECKKHEEEFDAIVVGAGIIGSGIAYKLAMAGKRTLLLEKEKLGHDNGSSHGRSRIIRYTHSDPMWLPLVHDAYAEWAQLELSAGKKLLVKNGLLTMDTNVQKTKNRVQVLKEFKVPNDRHFKIEQKMLTGPEITEHFPHLRNYGPEWSAVYEPSGATLLADKCLETLQELFVAKGGVIKAGEKEVHTNPLNDHVEVHTEKKDGTVHVYRAKNVVFALGGWLPNHPFLKDLPIATEALVLGSYFWDIRPESHRFYKPIPVEETHKKDEHHMPEHDHEQHHAKRQKVLKNEASGSSIISADVAKNPSPQYPSPTLLITNPTKENDDGTSGSDNADDLEELYAIPGIDDPEKIKFCIHKGHKVVGEIKVNKEREEKDWMLEMPRKHLREHLPSVRADLEPKRTTCIYTMTADGKFIVDRHHKHSNVLIAGGFSGTGFKFGPTIGKLIVHLIDKAGKGHGGGKGDGGEEAGGSSSGVPTTIVPLADGLHFDLAQFSLHRKVSDQMVMLR